MIGTLINAALVFVGGLIGYFLGARLPERIRQTVVAGLGLFTLGLGLQMFFKAHNILIVLGSLLLGALLGEWLGIEERLADLGRWLEKKAVGGKTGDGQARFVRGFLTASLLFCVGPMTILGSIQDGLVGDYTLLAIKSVMDGFAALAFASTLGLGVLFSVITILVYQGGLSLLASTVQAIMTPVMMDEMTAVGGIIMAGIAVGSLLELKPIRTGSFLPALLIAPVLVGLLDWLKILFGF